MGLVKGRASPAILFLIGPRGSGKTTVGRALASLLPGWTWTDADEELERRAGLSVREFFAQRGEEAFRQLEHAVLADLAARQCLILSAGGGVVLRPENREILKSRGMTIYLRADPATLRRRLTADESTGARRPVLLAGMTSPLEEIEAVLQRRAPLYEGCAELILDVGSDTPQAIALRLLSALPLRTEGT